MRFQIGSKVEVLSKKKAPSGVWRLAEIVSENGDEYTVRYERYPGISKGTVEKVKKDVVRPCPPLVKSVANWAVGDIVEVFDDGCWKVAVIETMEGEGFYVRLLGSFDEFKVQRGSIRVRQAWEDNKWIVLEKDSNPCEDLIGKALKRTLTQTGYRSPAVQDNIGVQEACLSCKEPKRSFSDNSADPEAYFGKPQKKRAVEKDGWSPVAVPECSSSSTEKVEAAVYRQDCWSGINCHASHIDNKISIDKANSAKSNPTDFCNRILERSDSDSTVSSVGSCSAINSGSNKLHNDSLAGGLDDLDILSSDADSDYRTGREEGRAGLPVKKKYIPRTHKSELHTYRGTLEALYACGPLSWELEIYLTDLRGRLHISSDEHLAEDEILGHSWLAVKSLNDDAMVCLEPCYCQWA